MLLKPPHTHTRAALLLLAAALLTTRPASAHRLDEYLQATVLALAPGSVTLTVRLVPGVAVAPAILADIDRNADGTLSPSEQTAYAQSLLADLSLSEDGHPLQLYLVNVVFPPPAQMQAGLGEITVTLTAGLPATTGPHQLTFTNRHKPSISVYLVNALVPQDPRFQITAQDRNQNQSVYQLSFTESASDAPSLTATGARSITAPGAPGLTAPHTLHLSGFAGAFHLGLRHIAEGTDHLLFLLTLLLPAPLLAQHHRWVHPAPVRTSLLHVLAIVTAFTLGHSLTLALSAFGLVQLPSRPIEIFIAVTVLVSAIHALRPLFPGREALIAALFGLVHGLAFASALNELGMTGWYRLVSLLGFNLGIETMQLLVVLATLPSFLLLSRTGFYAPFRILGGCLAAGAALAWIFERTTAHPTPLTPLIESLARHGIALATVLFLLSLLAWSTKSFFHNPLQGEK